MAMTLEDAERVFGSARGKLKRRGQEGEDWLADHTAGGLPAWAPVAGAAAVGFLAGMALLGGRKLAMQISTAFPGDWFAQLKAEHRLAETLFEAGLKTKDHETGRRTLLLAHLAYALLKHGLQEETVIYPALREMGAGGTAKALAAEHFDIKTFLHELSESPKDDPKWIKTWRAFYNLVKEHVAEEEESVFPSFHGKLSDKENAHLTRAMNREGIKLA